MTIPLIGITGRRNHGTVFASRDERFTGVDVDIFFSDYARCVAAAGGLPVHLPFEAVGAATAVKLDAIIITGGQDVHPSAWGGDDFIDAKSSRNPRTDFSAYDPERDDHEIGLVRAAVANGVPVLGVCRGHQVLNVALGGTLIPDLPTGEIEHYSLKAAPHDGAENHHISFAAGSLAQSIFGTKALRNSWHHQAVDASGDGLIVSGRAEDGVVEAIEWPGRPVLGVQWHPEWQDSDDPVFAWLVEAAKAAASRRNGALAQSPEA
jgi:putative glutamine amidotransferase